MVKSKGANNLLVVNTNSLLLLYSRIKSSRFRSGGRGLFILCLVLTSIVSYYYLSGNSSSWASALKEDAAFIDTLEIDTTQLSYYGSIFSNLSRGLPIDVLDSSSEPTNGQENEEDDIQQVNAPNSTVQQS